MTSWDSDNMKVKHFGITPLGRRTLFSYFSIYFLYHLDLVIFVLLSSHSLTLSYFLSILFLVSSLMNILFWLVYFSILNFLLGSSLYPLHLFWDFLFLKFIFHIWPVKHVYDASNSCQRILTSESPHGVGWCLLAIFSHLIGDIPDVLYDKWFLKLKPWYLGQYIIQGLI